MNKRQVIVLWIIALVLGVAVTSVKLSQNQKSDSSVQRSPGQTLLDSFPFAQAATVEIKGATGTVTLTRKDALWFIAERESYPAKTAFVNDFLRTLGEVEVTQAKEAGPSFAARFGMDEAATTAADRGLTATIKDSSGKEIAKVSLGKNIEPSAAMQDPMMGGSRAVGRYIRNHEDPSAFYAVSELFPSISDDATRWLKDEFINPENIKSITVSEAGKTDTAWELQRDAEAAEFKLNGATTAEVLDSTVSASAKALLGNARFEDIVSPAQATERGIPDKKRSVTLTTFDGFTYKLTLTPAKPSATPTGSDSILLTVNVSATLPKERIKAADEKPEDAKTKDSEFADKLKSLSEKLTKEQAFSTTTFEMSQSTVETLLKDRASLIAKPADAAPNPVQQLPGGMIANPRMEATTPPISIPGN
jgi:Domain of unknown function (DUF4340)